MGNYADFVRGKDLNHKKTTASTKPVSCSKKASDESYWADSRNFSHLKTSDIPQPKGKIFRGKR